MLGIRDSYFMRPVKTEESELDMDINLRSALVTGANRGIGLATAKALLDAGCARVYACARDLEKLNKLVDWDPDRVVPIELDVTKPKQINAAAKAAKDVTILVNNAGMFAAGEPLSQKNSLKGLKSEWDVNVLGMLRVTQAFLPNMKKASSGAIVNLNSVASLKSFPFAPTYSASKAAAFSATQGLRNELHGTGIHVVSVFPGPVDTDMAEGVDLPKATPEHVAGEIVRSIQQELAFLFPDSFALDFWHDFESRPGPFLAEAIPAR
jgi:NAD(P)-dependent dehydrogenase (short-subunit alcohol dehydrogenase family)